MRRRRGGMRRRGRARTGRTRSRSRSRRGSKGFGAVGRRL